MSLAEEAMVLMPAVVRSQSVEWWRERKDNSMSARKGLHAKAQHDWKGREVAWNMEIVLRTSE